MACLVSIPLVFGALVSDWHFQANDNTRGGWLAFFLYVTLAFLSWREVARQGSSGNVHRSTLPPSFWLLLSLGVTALGINKQLDLQTWLIQFGRDIVASEGFLAYRRLINAGFVAAAAIAAAFAATYLWRLARRTTNPARLVVIGTVALVGFVLVRVASINHVSVVGGGIDRHRPMLALEIVILSLLCLAIWRNARSS